MEQATKLSRISIALDEKPKIEFADTRKSIWRRIVGMVTEENGNGATKIRAGHIALGGFVVLLIVQVVVMSRWTGSMDAFKESSKRETELIIEKVRTEQEGQRIAAEIRIKELENKVNSLQEDRKTDQLMIITTREMVLRQNPKIVP